MIYKIFLVEDDPTIVSVLDRQLAQWDYLVHSVEAFDAVMEEFTAFEPHLVLLDVSLPFYDGYYWCEKIRRVSKVPILFISSATDEMNLVMAVNMGADDFVSKPFQMKVILAKIQALLRRTYSSGMDPSILTHKGVTLNLNSALLSYDTQTLELSRNELKILQVLLENKGTVVTRESLMQELWQTDSFVDDNTLTVNIARLRKHLEEAGLTGFITTKKGLGYLVEE